jgi:hypothetical protein
MAVNIPIVSVQELSSVHCIDVDSVVGLLQRNWASLLQIDELAFSGVGCIVLIWWLIGLV